MFIVASDPLYNARLNYSELGGGLLASLSGSNQVATFCTVGFLQSTASFATLPNYMGDSATFDVSSLSLTNPAAIEIAGIRYSASPDPSNLMPGEFYWDRTAQLITVKFLSV